MSNQDQIGEAIKYVFMTDNQEIAMSLLYVISSTFSILGSLTIIFKVLSDRKHATSYDRLMLGLSCSDIVSSLGWLFTPFLLPRETSPRVWAIGNNGTCTFLGFMTQLGFSSVFYNAFLGFYFLATIRLGVKRETFAKTWEPSIHVFVALFSFITSGVGVAVGFFSELSVGMGCWVNDYPKGCIEGCAAETIAWIYGPMPVFFAVVSLMVNNGLVYCHVRNVFRVYEAAVGDEVNYVIMRQDIHKREVATQGFLYVAAFFFCYWPAATARGIEAFNTDVVNERNIYWVLMFQAGALPLQGLFNMIIYNRPNLKRVRAVNPHMSLISAIRIACLDKDIPRLTDMSEQEARVLARSSSNRRNRSNNGYDLNAKNRSKNSFPSSPAENSSQLSGSNLMSIQEESNLCSAGIDDRDSS